MDREQLDNLAKKIIGIAIEIHKNLGSGFAEKIYVKALIHDLKEKDIQHSTERIFPVRYKDLLLGNQRIDLLIENELIIEIKVVPKIQRIHLAQLLSYLKISNKKLGLVLNFGTPQLEIKRVVYNF